MKKTLVFGLIVAVLGFTACNKENPTQGENTKGMVLKATVEQPAEVRATINGETAEWKFAFASGDEIAVRPESLTADTYYTFTNDGSDFVSADAKITPDNEDWYAYFPSATIDLKNQPGTLEGVANLYALAGEQTTTGKGGLSITMSANVAILKIFNYEKYKFDINVKSGPSTWVVGMEAIDGDADFDLLTASVKNSLFTTNETGTYYVAVPAGVKLQILDGDKTLKFTQDAGLTAGKYYELIVGTPPYISSKFSVSPTKKVHFSRGNLQAKYTGSFYTWDFAANQYDVIGMFHGNTSIGNYGQNYNGAVVDLFGWSTPATNFGISKSVKNEDYSGDFVDWGIAYCVSKGITPTDIWRTLSYEEWQYLFETRTVNGGQGNGKSYSINITYDETLGTVIYPDDYTGEALSGSVEALPEGVVFLPDGGRRYGNDYILHLDGYFYWSSTKFEDNKAQSEYFTPTRITILNAERCYGLSVRLVIDAK